MIGFLKISAAENVILLNLMKITASDSENFPRIYSN